MCLWKYSIYLFLYISYLDLWVNVYIISFLKKLLEVIVNSTVEEFLKLIDSLLYLEKKSCRKTDVGSILNSILKTISLIECKLLLKSYDVIVTVYENTRGGNSIENILINFDSDLNISLVFC